MAEWKYTPDFHEVVDAEIDGLLVAIVGGSHNRAIDFDPDDQEQNRIGHMIAAAPELLAALQDFIKAADQWDVVFPRDMAEAYNAATTAYRKARGES